MNKLFIIAGHGAGDPGACGNGYQEAERVRALASRIKALGGDNVIVGDTSKNWYKSNLVNSNNIPKGSLVLELHMDSASSSAKGAHVIIDADFEADKYDKALAEFISGILPGRSQTIVKRNNLANSNRAQASGINYRLLECGFISNAGDVEIFNSRMDEIAKGILKCFNISIVVASSKPKHTKVNQKVLEWQKAAISDGFKFPKYGADGQWGDECIAVAKKALVEKTSIYKNRNLTKIVQRAVGVSADGMCGKKTRDAIIAYQKKHGLTADGCVGLNTWKKILGV